ncbi:MAG TPA: hypothetical protein VJG83_04295 [archaeon]|nr:hypothetical protein [archaeon]
MDTFNFILSSLLMMIAIQLQEPWIALGILVINILTSKELSTIIALILATVVMYFIIGNADESVWLIGIFAILVIGIVLGSKSSQPPQQDFGGMGGYGDMLGGLGGGGGY